MENEQIELRIQFSDKYERMLNKYRKFAPIIIFFGTSWPILFYKPPLLTTLLFLLFPLTIAILAYIQLLRGEGELPVRIHIRNDGIYAWKRNKKKILIPWENVYKIDIMDNITPEDYLLIANKNGKNERPKTFDYYELALDKNAALIAIEKFNEYKDEKGIL